MLLETSATYLGPAPRRYYTLIYRYRGKGSHVWTHRFTSLDGRCRYMSWEHSKTDHAWPPLMSHQGGPWERCAESATGWFSTFRLMLFWAVILDPDGKVVFDWKRPKEVP